MEKDNILTGKALADQIKKTIDAIELSVKKNNLQTTGSLNSLLSVGTIIKLTGLSKSQIKKINRASYYVFQKGSIRSMNYFLHILHKELDMPAVHIKVSKQEEQIQNARKEWKQAQKIAAEKLEKYKTLKGDYYKTKKFEKISESNLITQAA